MRAHPGTIRFVYDGQTVTLFLFSEKEWMYRNRDDTYRLASRWLGDLLQYRPPFGNWTDLARFHDGRPRLLDQADRSIAYVIVRPAGGAPLC